MTKKDTKISRLEKELEKHKKCLREKDRRLTRIEERFNFFKKAITGTIVIIMALVAIFVPIYFSIVYTDAFMDAMTIFGIFTFITILGTIVLFSAFYWEDGEVETNLVVSFLISVTLALLATVIISIHLINTGVI